MYSLSSNSTKRYRIGCVFTLFELLHALDYNAHQIREFILSFITRFGLKRAHINLHVGTYYLLPQ